MKLDAKENSKIEKKKYVETLIADYPNISDDEVEILLKWFRKEASALDVGLIASEASLQKGYNLFKKDHIDNPVNKIRVILITLATIALMSFMIIEFS